MILKHHVVTGTNYIHKKTGIIDMRDDLKDGHAASTCRLPPWVIIVFIELMCYYVIYRIKSIIALSKQCCPVC